MLTAALIWLVAPAPATTLDTADHPEVSNEVAIALINTHCVACHASSPGHPAFQAPPAGIKLENLSLLAMHADKVRQAAVDSHYMPLGNLTGMTNEERQLLGQWLQHNKP